MSTPQPTITVTVRITQQYGVTVARPFNNAAHLFASIAGTKTLTPPVLRCIRMLGIPIGVVNDSQQALDSLINTKD